jgi:hypothetical protein
MLGEAAATADDFTIDAAGKIEIRSKVSAERNLALTTTTVGLDAIGLNNASVSARQNIALTAASGGATLTGGFLVAGNNLTGVLGSLNDTASAAAITDNNKRYAAVNSTLAVTNTANIDGTVWGAGSALADTFGSLAIGATGATFYAGTTLGMTANIGNLSLGTAAITSAGNLSLTSATGAISTVAGAAQGIQTRTGNLALTAGNGLANAGVMTADAGSLTLRANGTVTNSGSMHAATTVDIADKNNSTTENFTNSGILLADTALTAKAANFTNTGSMQGTTGTTLTATSLNNSGSLIASNTAGNSGTFNLTALTNSGTLQSAEDLTFNVTGTLANSGKLLATHNLSALAGASALAITNSATGVMQAGNALALTGGNATLNTQAGTVLGNTVGLTLSSLNNSGTVQSETSSNYAIGNGITNSGTLLAKTTLTSNSASLTNSGTLQANLGATITTTGSINNTGSIIASNSTTNSGIINATTLTNSATGIIQSAHDLTVNLSSNTLDNAGAILADDNLTLHAAGSNLTITNQTGGYIQAGTDAGNALVINGSAVTLNNNAGAYVLGNAVDLTLDTLNNGGLIQSDTSTNYNIVNLTNTGTFLAKTTLTGTSTSVSNSGTLQANLGATLTATSLNNSGSLIASNTAGNSGTFNLTALTNSGTLQSAEDLTFNVTGTLANSGKLLATHNLSALAGASALAITNSATGVMQAGNALALTGGNATLNTQAGTVLGNTVGLTLSSLNNSGTVQSETSSNYAIGNGITNSGTLLAKTTLTSNSASLTNSGTLQANLGATITTTGSINNTGSIIASNSTTNSGIINATTLTNSATGIIQSAHDLTVNLSSNTLDNAGAILADDNLTLHAAGSNLTITNQTGGYIQAGTDAGNALVINGSAVTLNNNAGGVILGDQLDFTTTALTNAGGVQGGTSASTVAVSGTLSNSGTFNLASNLSGSGTITADTINNSGILQSNGSATLNVATSLINSNQLLSANALTVRGTDASYNINNTGRIQTGGLMDVKGLGGGRGVDVTVASAALMLGGSMDMNANTLTLNNNGMVSTTGAMTLGLNTLSFGGTTSRIVGSTGGAATTAISLVNGFSNNGAIHSGGTLNFTAPTITNTNTGGISALGTLSVSATGGNFTNAGALYAGNQLTASATGTFTNVATTGTIDSGGNMNLSAPTFVNNNTINAAGNITISAANFRNETPGGDTRTWGANSAVTHTQTGHDTKGYNGHGCCDQYQTWYYSDTWYRDQYYAGGTPTKPQIIGGTSLTIQNFNTGVNLGGVLSAGTVTLTGNSGSTFTNNDLALMRESYTDTYVHEIKYIAAGPATYYDDSHRNSTVTSSTSTLSSLGAGVFANTLNASGFSLTNAGSALGATVNPKNQTGAAGTALAGGASGTTGDTATNGTTAVGGAAGAADATGTTGSTGVAGTTTVNGLPAVSFGGLVIALPTNPNGYFVLSQNPQARFLVETNPLFNVGQNFIGSDYMALRLGLNVDEIGLRLGDAAYENYLIRQQLIAQTGRNIINGYANESKMMEGLYSSAASVSSSLGLSWGKPLTPQQIGNLTQDMVWMVETTVGGKKVLAPVVYLAAATKAAVTSGAVIEANNTNMDLTSVTNTGGTIVGKNSLTIKSKGDITNTSGTIKGGNVSLTSTEGSIVNQTLVQGSGNDKRFVSTVGKTAGIESTGNLNLNANKDIKVVGANVKAGGDATLTAGKEITFDTIVNKTTDTTHSSSDNGLNSTRSTTTTTTEKNIGSNLSVGGNLKTKSGGDTTIAGSTVTVGGNLDADAGGSFNVVARQDKTTSHTESNTSGLGVGGGLAGDEKVTTDKFKGTNAGSTLTVGGDAKVTAAKDIVLQGSDVTVAGNADLDAKGSIKVLDGLDEERTKTRTETTTILSVDTASTSGSGSKSESDKKRASASASAEATAEAENNSELNFSKTTVTDNEKSSKTSVASNLKVGGNLNAKAGDKVTIQGSNVEAGGDVNIDAKNVEVLAGRNEEFETTTVNTTKVGVFVDSKADASAEAKAKGTGMTANAKAGAEAQANGDSVATIGARLEKSEETSDKLTHTASTIKSGGNTTIKAKEEAKFQGANVESGGDLNIEAKDITNLAAEDHDITKKNSSRITTGVYIDTSADASASAKAKASPTGASAKAESSANAEAGAGLRVAGEKESSEEGSTSNVVNTFKAGGNLTRKAEGTIRDQGTQLEAGGNIDQSANKLVEDAISDKSWSSSSNEAHDGRIGVYAGAGAEANAGAQEGVGGSNAGADAGAEASAGFKAKYTFEGGSESESSTKAVTSSYKAGGNITSKTKEETKLVGTKMESGGDISLEAKSLDFQAARDTTTEKNSDRAAEGEIKVGVVGTVGGEGSASYEQNSAEKSTSTATAGKLSSTKGNISIKTKDDARFEGTEIEADKNVSVTSTDGSVKFDSAKSTVTEHSEGFDMSANIKVQGKEAEGGASGGYNQRDANETTNTVAKIKSGSGNVDISAGKDATFEGTQIDAKGDTNIAAKGEVKLLEAKDVKQENAVGFHAEVELSGESQSGGASVSAMNEDKQSGNATKINSGGKLNITGKKVVSQEAELSGEEKTITGKQENLAKTNVDTGYDLAFDIDATRKGGGDSKSDGNDAGSSKGTDKPDSKNNAATDSGSKPVTKEEAQPTGANSARTPEAKPITPAGDKTDSQLATKEEAQPTGANSARTPEAKPIAPAGDKTDSQSVTDGKDVEKTSSGAKPAEGTTNPETESANTELKAEVGEKFTGSVADAANEAKTIEEKTEPTSAATPPQPVAPIKVVVVLPVMPPGKSVEVNTADGKPLPEWVKFDSTTGTFSGNPPSDFKGAINIVVKIPQSDGSVKDVPVTFAAK